MLRHALQPGGEGSARGRCGCLRPPPGGPGGRRAGEADWAEQLSAVSLERRGLSVRYGGHDWDSNRDVPGMAAGEDCAVDGGGEVRPRHRLENRATPARG